MRVLIVCFVLTGMLYGCSSSKHNSERDAKEAALSHMIYSPNGEPLNGSTLGRPTCEAALSGWFERVDTNHDNAINHDEFLADAKAQFLRMDLDHNGYLVSEELERYRRPYRQEHTAEQPPSKHDKADSDTSEKGGRRHSRSGNDNSDESPGDTSDPVMAADTNLDFKVTPEEFTAHAEKIFSTLDSNQGGSLSRDEVLAQCQRKP